MKKLLILQMRPEDETAESELTSFLKISQLSLENVDRIRVEQMPDFNFDPERYFAVIAGGSPFDISKPQQLKSEQQLFVESFFSNLFNQIIPMDFPFLGACSGNGLLGNYCGTSISGKFAEKVGKTEVSITFPDGRNDKLLKGLPEIFTVLVGHKEACDELPAGAKLLITSDYCPVQMFRLKENIYATQFHPEADEMEFNLRIDTYKDFGYFKPEEADKIRKEIAGVNTYHAQEILRRFVHCYRDLTH